MQQILEKLYLGELAPWENKIKIDGYRDARHKSYTRIEEFNQELNPKQQKLLEDIVFDLAEVHSYEATQAFVDGFKLAVNLMLESSVNG